MTYETFPHEADIGIRGAGNSVEEAFEEAAKAMFDVEVDVKKVKAEKEIKIECEAENREELLIEWLNALLAEASLKEMIFSKFKIKIFKEKRLKIKGVALGEKLKQEHNIKNEIKGATYSQLKVYQNKNFWIAQCVVDV